MLRHLIRFAGDESGATAVEYGLIAMLLGVALLASLSAVGTALNNNFSFFASAINTAH